MTRKWSRIGLLTAMLGAMLAAAGCTGTDILETGYRNVSFALTPTGVTDQPYDCITWGFLSMRVRPLGGKCGADSANAGEACHSAGDCVPGSGSGTCVGSNAEEVIGGAGILVTVNPSGTILPNPCQLTLAGGGICPGVFAPTFGECSISGFVCTKDSDCPSGGTCLPSGECPDLSPCILDSDCAPGPCTASASIAAQCFSDDDCRFCLNAPTERCQSDADCGGSTCKAPLTCENQNDGLIPTVPFAPPASLILTPGLYEINEVIIGDISVYIDAPQPPLFPSQPFIRTCSGPEDVTNAFGKSLRFTVPATGDKTVRFAVDIGELEDALTGLDFCDDVASNILSILSCETCDAGISP